MGETSRTFITVACNKPVCESMDRVGENVQLAEGGTLRACVALESDRCDDLKRA